MTTEAPVTTERRPFRFFLSLLHLLALGVFGTAAVTMLVTLLAAGVGLIPAFGVGVALLIGVVYAIYGVSWFETRRVAGLYQLQVPDLRFAQQLEPGFGQYLRSLWEQMKNARMWRAFASLSLASLFGLFALGFVQEALRLLLSIGGRYTVVFGFSIDRPVTWLFGVVGSLVLFAAVFLLVLLHRTVCTAIIDGGAHEEDLRDQVRSTTQQREGALRAADVERTRIERDLHDGVQPRLVSIGMTLGLAKETIETNPEGAKALLDEAHTSTKAAVTELRQLARGIHASVLDDRGLDAALSALAGRSHVPVVLDSRIEGAEIARATETAVYFAVAEALTNAAKHSFAAEVRVSLRIRTDESGRELLWARVEDNGEGGATVQPGGGLDGIINRITAAGGSTLLSSPAGGPTTIEVTVPCAS